MEKRTCIRSKTGKKYRSSRKSKSKFYGGMPGYCGKKNLLQTILYIEQITNWKPLSCAISDPKNCGPTALKLMFPKMSDSKIQDLSYAVERSGITLEQFNEVMYEQLTQLDVIMTSIRILPDILIFFKKNLIPGYLTVIGLEGAGSINHITTVAKDLNDNIILFDGQTNSAFTNDDIIKYITAYTYMYIWCSKHKYKRPAIIDLTTDQFIQKKRKL